MNFVENYFSAKRPEQQPLAMVTPASLVSCVDEAGDIFVRLAQLAAVRRNALAVKAIVGVDIGHFLSAEDDVPQAGRVELSGMTAQQLIDLNANLA